MIDIKLPGLARLVATLRSGEREPTMTEQQPVCKWSYQTKGRIGRFSPAVARNGTVYVGDVAARDGAVIFGGRRHDKSSGQPDRLMALDRWGAEFARVADLSRRMSHTRREARKIPLDTPRFPQP
jgi:hypothetical protein